MYQQLTELHRYLLAIQNSPVPGKSALQAVQLRLDQNSSDPIFATRQRAKTLPAPLNRWVGKLADQAWHVVMVEAVRYMEVDLSLIHISPPGASTKNISRKMQLCRAASS